ncbi:glycosyltransferase family 39 protein, partial [Candidatus Collierbacteria bacterium]|nr:glycosyltransferase family 39 protein [Candidatus Collierbacteria bacterium]
MEKTKITKLEIFLISLVILLCLGLRLYKIDQYMTFLGDEGRDVRVVSNLLSGNLVFIGPQTSIGNMYLGPLYYYLIAPALALSGGNPVGPAIEVAFLGTLTVFLTWWFGRTWFGRNIGLLAALLFALSPVAIIYSRSSWNPNPMPLFSLLTIWSIWQVYRHKRFGYLSLVGITMAFALQMHYLGLLLIPVLGIYWLLTLKSARKIQKEKSLVIRNSILGIILFLVLMSPLALFDLKHDFMNLKAFQAFFSDRQTTINLNPGRSDRFLPVLSQITTDMVLARQTQYALIVGITIILFTLFFLINTKKKSALILILTWLFFGALGLSVYKQHVYAHYYGFIYPAIYLLVAFIIVRLWQMSLVTRFISLASLAILIYLSVIFSPVKDTPNNQLARTREISSLIIKESEGEPFNFGLIAKQNYDESYRYFFEVNNAKMFR